MRIDHDQERAASVERLGEVRSGIRVEADDVAQRSAKSRHHPAGDAERGRAVGNDER